MELKCLLCKKVMIEMTPKDFWCCNEMVRIKTTDPYDQGHYRRWYCEAIEDGYQSLISYQGCVVSWVSWQNQLNICLFSEDSIIANYRLDSSEKIFESLISLEKVQNFLILI